MLWGLGVYDDHFNLTQGEEARDFRFLLDSLPDSSLPRLMRDLRTLLACSVI